MTRHPLTFLFMVLLLVGSMAPIGCAPGVDTTYGRVRSRSVNGTAALAELIRQDGHTVRVAVRLNDQVGEEADTIIRFAPYPGPPAEEEADWYLDWLYEEDDRRLIYVCRDYDAEAEYWASLLDKLPKEDPKRERIETLQSKAKRWPSNLPDPPDEPADPEYWFEIEDPEGPTFCQTLTGPWASDIDPETAKITRHRALIATVEDVLLEGDGFPLAMEWSWYEKSSILVLANGSFLLNATLVNPARRPLAFEVVHWAIAGDAPRQVIFVEGASPLSEAADAPPSPWELFSRVPQLGWIAGHFAALGLVAALAFAVALGRPRSLQSSGADRPKAHAEALGTLLAKTHDERAARALLEIYSRWRHVPGHDQQRTQTRPRPRSR